MLYLDVHPTEISEYVHQRHVHKFVMTALLIKGKNLKHLKCSSTIEQVSELWYIRVPQLLKPVCLEPMLHNKGSHHNEKPTHCKEE